MSYFQKNVFFSFKLFLISVLPFVMLSSWEFANKRSTFGSGCHCLGFLWLPSVCLGEDHNYGTCICMYIRVCFFKDFLLYIFWCDELFLRVLNQEWLIWLTARKDPDNGIRIWENMRESCIHFFPYTSFHICTLYILYILHHMIHACFFPCYVFCILRLSDSPNNFLWLITHLSGRSWSSIPSSAGSLPRWPARCGACHFSDFDAPGHSLNSRLDIDISDMSGWGHSSLAGEHDLPALQAKSLALFVTTVWGKCILQTPFAPVL